MAMKRFVLLLLLSTHSVHAAEPCFKSTFVDEGLSYTLTRYMDKAKLPKGLLIWQVAALPKGTTLVTECLAERSPRCRSLLDEKSYTSTMEDWNETQYRVTLTIHSVSRIRDHATWTWGGEPDVLGSCDLNVSTFRFPPSCNAISYLPDLDVISWACSVKDVYPQVTCQFNYLDESRSTTQQASLEYINPRYRRKEGEAPPRTTLYDVECILNLPINELIPSQVYQFYFSAVMELANGARRSKSFGHLDFYIPTSSTSTTTTIATPTTKPLNTSSISHVSATPNPPVCPFQAGFLYPHSSDCRLYRSCDAGIFTVHTCRSGKVFSVVVGACVQFNSVLDTCSRLNPISGCSIRPDNKDFQIPHPTQCRMYYQCKMDAKSQTSYYIQTSCPSSQLYDLIEKRCRGQDETFCGFDRVK